MTLFDKPEFEENSAGKFGTRRTAACQEIFLTRVRLVGSVGSRTANRVGILEETDVGVANYSRLLHCLLQIFRRGKLACVLEAVPIKKDSYFARIVHRQQHPRPNFTGCFAHAKMPVKRFLPAGVICDLMPND